MVCCDCMMVINIFGYSIIICKRRYRVKDKKAGKFVDDGEGFYVSKG